MKNDDRIIEPSVAVRQMETIHDIAKRASGLVDPRVLARRFAHMIQDKLGAALTAVGIREYDDDDGDVIIIRGTAGARTRDVARVRVPAGQGVGGRVLVSRRPVIVSDYEHDADISKEFAELVVRREGIRGMAGVPLEDQGEVVGVLYAGQRSSGVISDRAVSVMTALAPFLASDIATSRASQMAARLMLQQERLRIAHNLHDSVGQMLFGIGVAAQRAKENVPPQAEDLLTWVNKIQEQTSEAATHLRDALRVLTPSAPGDALPLVVRMDAEAFRDRTGLAIDCIVLGRPVELDPEIEAVLLGVIREALHNAEKHADADSIIVALAYDEAKVEVVVQDDGRGLPGDVVLDPIRATGNRLGLAFLLQRVERIGGMLLVRTNEDGGVTLRASIPTGAATGG